jgi:chloramphenicol-sensitive protein RarD
MNNSTIGLLYALIAFVSWGLLPIYWKQLEIVPPFEILCHRIIWSFIFIAIILTKQKRWNEIKITISNKKYLSALFISSILIGTNWFIYIWAVNSGKVLESSLGYYINPIVNILIGFILLKEKLSNWQWFSVFLVFIGVSYSIYSYGQPPYFALTLAVSFAFYGYSRKKIKVKPIPALFIETLILLIPSLLFIIYKESQNNSLFLHDTNISLWLIGSGIATTLPLLWFANSTKLLDLSTVGIMQYIAPTIGFFLGVFLYKEYFDINSLITFIFIWIGVIIYIIAMFHQYKKVSKIC